MRFQDFVKLGGTERYGEAERQEIRTYKNKSPSREGLCYHALINRGKKKEHI
jgi:hypothetical protein